MATIRMLKTAATPEYSYTEPYIYPGVPLERAKTLVEAGAAVFVQEEPERAVAPEPEVRESVTKDWPMKLGPDVYLERFPEGKHADLARRLLGV